MRRDTDDPYPIQYRNDRTYPVSYTRPSQTAARLSPLVEEASEVEGPSNKSEAKGDDIVELKDLSDASSTIAECSMEDSQSIRASLDSGELADDEASDYPGPEISFGEATWASGND